MKKMKAPSSISRLTSSGSRFAVAHTLVFLLLLQTTLPVQVIAFEKLSSTESPNRTPSRIPPVSSELVEHVSSKSASSLPIKPLVAPQSSGIVLTAISTAFNDLIGIDHHQPTNKILLSANSPSGLPDNFELADQTSARNAFSNVAGLAGEFKIATARDDGQGMSLGGFTSGELFSGTASPGVIARIAADGSSVQNPWLILPGETGLANGGLYIDRTGVFGGDLIVATTQGGVWRVSSSGAATLLANLGTHLQGATTIPNDSDRYGPWAGKILVGADQQGKIYSVDLQGTTNSYQLGMNPEDIRIIPAQENFYGVDIGGRKLWGAPAAAFTGMIGNILVAQGSPGTLSLIRWNGAQFDVSQIAQVSQWKQVTFSPAGLVEVASVQQVHDRIAVVRHAPLLDSGRVEGALWQLLGEAVTLDGSDVITSDLLVPGTPAVNVSGSPEYDGTIVGTGNTQPSGYEVSIGGHATLRHLITRTDPIQLQTVSAPPAPAGTRDVALDSPNQSAGDWATVRNLTLTGNAGAVSVPPGTYGQFSASSHTALVLGVENSVEPAAYNLDSLTLAGASELRLAGPVTITVNDSVTITGSTVGAAANPRRLLLRVAQGNLRISGSGVLYGIVQTPSGTVTIEGTGILRGTVSCDRLIVNGNGILQITENDIPQPPLNRPPTVNAGPDQTITLPTSTVSFNGIVSDDALPEGSTLSVSWSKLSGPGAVGFTEPNNVITSATFSQAGTYVIRLTANDTLLTSVDDVTITVVPHNQAPTVDAGPDQTITLPNPASLSGTVSDDGLPSGSTVSAVWSKASGPGDVSFANPNAADTTATFGAAGVYVLRLSATDSELTAFDELTITVNQSNRPPTVNAGPDQIIHLPAVATLNGTVSDDGLPAGASITASWSKVGGPGAVTFGNAGATGTTATFALYGIYTLRLTASDSEFTVTDDVTVIVEPSNQPPSVDGGPDQNIALPNNVAALSGATIDDGLPAGALTIAWSKISGPGQVTFGSANLANTSVTFSAAGTYVLRLTANDGEFGSSDDVTVTVTNASSATPGGIFITGHDSDFHSVDGPNTTGARHIIQRGIEFVTFNKPSPRILLVTDLRNPGSGFIDPRLGMQVSGFTTFDVADFGSGTSGALNLNSVSFGNYDVIVVASDFGGWLRQDELNILNARSADLINFINGGGGLVAFSESGLGGLTTSGRFGYLPFLVSSALFDQHEAGITLTQAGLDMGLTQTDINNNFSHCIFTTTGGMDVIDIDSGGHVLSLATRGKSVTPSGLDNKPPFVSAGLDQVILAPTTSVSLSGSVTDDGLPTGSSVSVSWSKVSGPGVVSFGNLNQAVSAATFSEPGIYVLRLTATDSQLSSSDDVRITIDTAPSLAGATLALAPVSAGPYVTGNIQSLLAILRDSSNNPIAGFAVQFTVSGPNSTNGIAITNGSGAAEFSYAGTSPGTDTAQAATQGGGLTVPSNIVTLQWASTATSPAAVPGWIGGPANHSTVTGITPIVLGQGITLTQGSVVYWPESDPSDVKTLTTTAQGGPESTIASLDTTLLANGSYVIRLSGTDSTGQQLTSLVLVTVAGENKPGRMTISVTDFTVPLAGLPITIGRTYDSLERGHVGDFGFGWSLSIGSPRLEVSASHDVTLTQPDGRRVTFFLTPQASSPFFPFLLTPVYTPEPGTHGSLISDGCTPLIRSGNGFTCFLGFEYQPTTYVYTDPYGRVYTMGADGKLRSIRDLNGNTLTFSANGITSSVGNLNVPFVRDSQGRITEVTDPAGNVYRYNYDGAGNLATVNLPGLATSVVYSYDSSHLYLSSHDPRGNSEATATYYPDGRVATLTDAVGNTKSYAYNPLTHTTTVTNPDGGVTTLNYDSHGMLLNETDPLGHTTSFSYDSNHQKLTETNALGQVTRYTYDSRGNQSSVTDALGNVSRTTYNQFGGPVTATDQIGTARTVAYDANLTPTSVGDSLGTIVSFTVDSHGSPLTFTDGNGAVTRLTYDAFGNLLTRTDPLNRVTSHTYDQMGRVLTTTDSRGNATSYSYDALGRTVTTTDPLGGVTRYEYDPNGNRTAQVDALGRRTTYTYDAANRLTSVAYPDNTSISYTYDFRDKKLTETDQLGRTTTFTYDRAGRPVKTTHPDGAEVVNAYDAIGRVISETDERGNVTGFEYDPACGCRDRLTKITDALGRVTINRFDAAGRRTSFVDANNRETRYSYDARNRQTLITYPDGTTTRQTYDGVGRPITKIDQAGRVTTYGYDSVGELISVTNALNQTTSHDYDVNRNLLTTTDANNHVTRFEYDQLNRLTRRLLPLGMSETFAYDAAGNRLSKTDFNGKTTTFAYDVMNRLLSKTPDATLGEPTVTFTYAATGQRATMVDAGGTTSYTYDNRNRLASKATPQGTLTYTYDAASNLLSMNSSNANGVSVNYSYDVLNRLATVVDNRLASGTTTYGYDAVGSLSSYVYPNGVQSGHTYDSLNRLTNLTHSKAASLASYAYTLSPTGRRLSVTELSGRRVNYSYDALYRLTNEAITADPVSANNGSIGYTYDAVANRLSRTSTLAAISSATSAYDANDRLTSDGYDANGNSTTATGTAFAYDFENRIKSVNNGAVTIVYDGDGNRVAKTVGGVTTRYLVDDLNPTGFAQVVEEVVSGSAQRVYTYGNSLISQNQLIGGNWAASFYGYDGQGSVRFLTDTIGTITDRYDYDAFGNLISSSGSTPNNYLYRGEQFDADISGYYLRARYYSQQRGRFLTIDLILGQTDDPITLHKYLYANADPVNRSDPSGLQVAAGYAVTTKERVLNPDVRGAIALATYAAVCVLFRAASEIEPGINRFIPPPFNQPPCISETEEVTVYRGIKGTNPGEFKIDDDGLSTYESLNPGIYPLALPFQIRYKKPKLPGTTGIIIAPVFPGGVGTYTPELGDPQIGTGHWSLRASGVSDEEFKKLLSEYAKRFKKGL